MHPADPYATPRSSAGDIEPISISALGELVKGWEKLRLLYNGVLLLPGIGVLAVAVSSGSMNSLHAVATGFLCGLCANVAFFAGPLVELYLRVILFRGAPKPWLRKCLLIGGFLISFGTMALFLVSVILTWSPRLGNL